MQKSMTDLKTLAFHGFENLYPPATGAITVFKTMTNHMVLRNQETVDSLHEWIHKFDIRKVNNGNVSVACAQCRAVIRALGGFGLPANVLRCILDGFAHATNESFKQLCVILSTMNRSTLTQDSHANKSVKHKCFNVLEDLELAFINLLTGHNWEGVGHNGSEAFLV